MDRAERAYIKLQKHLDNQAVGFPATRSGVEIKILKHIFTPLEAEIVSHLNYKPEPLNVIFDKVAHLVEAPSELEKQLDRIRRKGGIETKKRNGLKLYCCAPLVVGMYEFQLKRLTPRFVEDFNRYTSYRNFGVAYLSTELPQMRTIPVSKSINPQHHVSTYDALTTLLGQAEEPFVVFECICRTKKSIEGEPCKATDRKESCLATGDLAEMALENGFGRQISRDEALHITEKNQKDGLMLQPSNTEKAEFICSCCGCCCGMLAVHKKIPKPLDYWATNYHAAVNTQTCTGCGICEKRCQVGAVTVCDTKKAAVMDLNRCLGCGLCVDSCPTGAMSLLKKPSETRPPQTREDLYDIIKANKKGKLGKLKVTGKLVIDAVRTGQTHLLVGIGTHALSTRRKHQEV